MSIKQSKTIHLICGARPNFMKIAPLFHALKNDRDLDVRIIHTGQHYDPNMSDGFFSDLELPTPHEQLDIGSGSHAEQTAKVMIAYEGICLARRPDMTVVVGDVNSTMACALVAAKLGIFCAHLEAGLRSFDRTMPEEINRVVTDSIADLLWTPSRDGDVNLVREGVARERVQFVGNIMIDALEFIKPKIDPRQLTTQLNVTQGAFGIATFHRPSNVDSLSQLETLVAVFEKVCDILPLVCPLHPRTRARVVAAGLMPRLRDKAGLTLIEPLGYRDFMGLLQSARVVVTDSGGIQEETTYLGIPCLTVRENTERPVTITEGTNQLVSMSEVEEKVAALVALGSKHIRRIPELWDGKTAKRVRVSIRKVLFGEDDEIVQRARRETNTNEGSLVANG